jgi:hypothetical protein
LPITPEDNAITRQVRQAGFRGIPALLLQNNVIYLQTKGRKIRELTGGSVEYGGYTDVDLTQLATHITRGGVTQICSGEIPDTALYVVSGGELAVLTYERAQNVAGWTRWITDGVVESVATCPGQGEDDDIYISVLRTNGRMIERLSPDMLRKEEDNDVASLVFLDSAVIKSEEPPFTNLDGLGHLEGLEVEVFADGQTVGMHTVVEGAVTLSIAASIATAGLPFTSFIRTMPLDQNSIGDKAGISDTIIRVRNSRGVECSQDERSWTRLVIETPYSALSEVPPPLVSGDGQAAIQANWKRKPTFSIRQTAPLPMTILSIRISGKTSR